MKKQFILLILLVLLCSLVYAQESENPSPDDYKSESFYKTHDPAEWDWSKVDFTNLAVYQHPKLYLTPAFSQNFHRVPAAWYGLVKFYQLDFNKLPYSSLSDEFYQHPAFLFHLKRVPGSKYSEVKWDKVDFTKIRFKDVDWNVQLPSSFHQSLAKNQNALNNYCHEQSGQQCGITVDGGDVGGVVFTGKGIKTEQYGVELKHYPAGTLFEVKDGKIVAHVPNVQSFNSNLLSSDKVQLIMPNQIKMVILLGKKSEVKMVQGTVDYLNGDWFIASGKKAVINGVEISAAQQIKIHGLGGRDDAYFRKIEADIQNPKTVSDLYAEVRENAVYLGANNIFAFGARCENCPITAETVTLTFKQKNPYITIKPGGDPPYQQSFEDKLSITPVHGGVVWNNAAGELTVAGRVRMQNGVQEIIFDNGGVYAKAVLENQDEPFFDSVPMTVRFFDETMNNPYRDDNGQQLKDKNGKPIDNTIHIHEDNYIEFGNVEYFALAVDPYHLLTDTINGFKLVNNIAHFIKPLIIVETPAEYPDPSDPDRLPKGYSLEELKKYEQIYLDTAAEIFKTNSGSNWLPIVVRLENAENKQEAEERNRLHQNFVKTLDEDMKQNYAATEKVSEQVIIGHSRILWASGQTEVNVGGAFRGSMEMAEYCFPERVIGCSIADAEIVRIYRETVEELKDTNLIEGTGVDKNGKAVGGDYYVDKLADRAYLSNSGFTKTWPTVKQKLDKNKLAETFDWKEKDNTIDSISVKTEAAPLYAALKVIQLKYPYLRKNSIVDLFISPELETIYFPVGPFADEVAGLIKKITGKRPNLKSK